VSGDGDGRLVPLRAAKEARRGPWSILDADEVVAAIVSLFIVVAGTFVIILVDTWLGVALVALAVVAYFVLSFLHIGASRRRVAQQFNAFDRDRRTEDR